MARKPKPKTCKCSQRDGVHEVTCPAFDVDAELDANVGAPDLVAAAAHTNGAPQTEVERMEDDDEGEDDERTLFAATVDGDEALIDATPTRTPSLVARPSRDELLDALLRAKRVWSQEKTALELQKSKFKLAQMSIDAIVSELAASWEERNQLELPLAADPPVLCSNCGLGEATVPVLDAERWCVPCVQANLIPNSRSALARDVVAAAEAEAADGAGSLGPVIYALSAALRFEDIPEWADVEALANDPRSPQDIAADLARIAGQNSYSLSTTTPFVHKLDAAELAPA